MKKLEEHVDGDHFCKSLRQLGVDSVDGTVLSEGVESEASLSCCEVLHAAVPEKVCLGIATADVHTLNVLANLGKANIMAVLGDGSFPEGAAGIVAEAKLVSAWGKCKGLSEQLDANRFKLQDDSRSPMCL